MLTNFCVVVVVVVVDVGVGVDVDVGVVFVVASVNWVLRRWRFCVKFKKEKYTLRFKFSVRFFERNKIKKKQTIVLKNLERAFKKLTSI